jgi:DeoR family transcriptional regulator, aga operon transcriptional repressor
MRQSERLDSILERLSEDGSVAVTGLARTLGVSSATIRRDLELLESQRLLARTHGGAVSRDGVLYELPLRYRTGRHEAEKRRIAAAAATRLGDARAVGLTGGTTTTEVARRIAGRKLTVVTNAINIASELTVRPNLKLVVTGGRARPESYELVGPLADATLDALNIDVAFVGVDGASRAGMTTHDDTEAHTNRRMIERARRVVVVCDASKIGRAALAVICPARDVDELITDGEADPAELDGLRAAGVNVIVV